MRKNAFLTYDPSKDQWGVKLRGRWYRMSCGERFGLKIGRTYVGCRLELDTTWYVELPDNPRFILHPRSAYSVSVEA